MFCRPFKTHSFHPMSVNQPRDYLFLSSSYSQGNLVYYRPSCSVSLHIPRSVCNQESNISCLVGPQNQFHKYDISKPPPLRERFCYKCGHASKGTTLVTGHPLVKAGRGYPVAVNSVFQNLSIPLISLHFSILLVNTVTCLLF